MARQVANILAKLGFRSRTQIATWVADRSVPDDRPDMTTQPPSR